MGELAESDDNLNEADIEEREDSSCSESDERSFMESDEEREVVKQRKEKGPKLNNSFTGPYPTDPCDFNHTDKGPNFQFE